jgi:hypothetical protein
MKTSILRSIRVILPLLCGVAMLLLAAPARATGIALVDNELNANSSFNNSSTYLVLNTNLTVTSSANTLVVVVTFRNSTAAIEAPSTLGWTNATVSQTLTRVAQIESKAAGGGRCSAIYYLYSPTAGTGFNINGKLSGQTGSSGTSGALVAYTLSGVDTTVVPPPSGAASQSQGASDSSFSTTINNITANSWAAVGGVIGEADTTHTIAASNGGTATGTPVLTATSSGFASTSEAAMGYISTIVGGSDLFTYTFAPSANSDAALTVAIFAPTATPTITTQPQNASAFSGGTWMGVFNVAANGTSLSYQWYSTSSSTGALTAGESLTNAVALTGATKYSGTTASTLIVSNVVATDLTNYAVVITGSSVSVTSSVVSLSSVPVQNQVGDVIGVNMTFTTAYESVALTLNPTDLAGAVPATNWNNYIANSSWPFSQGTNTLYNDAGANTGAGMTLAGVDNGYYNTASSITSASAPNAKLLHDVLVLRNGVTDTLTFTNLPAIGNYDVYVYLSGQDNNDQLSVQCLNNGVSYYQEALGTAITNNQVLLQGNNTTSGTYPICNYVVFSGVTPAASGNAISFSLAPSPLSGNNGGVAGVELVPSGATFLGFIQQPQTVYIPSGQNATFYGSANGNPAVSSYQWYSVGGGVTNLLTGATSSSYTTNAPTLNGTSYFVVAGNGSINVTSIVAALNITDNGIWTNIGGGSWNASAPWLSGAIASGVGAKAWFTNDQGGTITLDNAAGWTVGTNIFGTNGNVSAQTPWIINSGSPAGTLTMAVNPTVPTSVVSGGSAPTVSGVPVITVLSNNPVTINAPLAGNQGLFINGGGTLTLGGNNTITGPTVVGGNSSDVTSLQIGNGGTSGAIDFTQPILYLSGYGQLIFNRSDTITLQSALNDQDGKCPNLIVNSGTVIWAPTVESSPYDGAIVNNGGTLVLDSAAGIYAIANNSGTVQITNGLPATSTDGDGNGGNAQNVSLGINSGGTVRLAGPGGNGVNIKNDSEGVLDNGVLDLAGDAIQVGFLAGSGIVTNSSSTNDILTLSGATVNAAYPWNGTIADGTTAKTAVTTSAGTTVFNGANTYTGPTLISGTLILSNSASLASANIYVNGANLILVDTPTLTGSPATLFVGSGRAVNFAGLSGNFTLNAGQTLVVTNTGALNAGANAIAVVAAAGSTLVPGGYGVAGTMTNNANLTLNGNTNVFDLATASTEGGGVNDEIVGVTNLTLSGNITIQVNTGFNSTFSAATTYKLIKYAGTLANTATFTVVPATLGGNPVTVSTATAGYVTLNIAGNSAPSLSATATNVDGFTGYPVTLSVAEAGSTPITNQWFNGATAVAGATNLSYTFTPATPGVYTYTLYATNAFGNTNQTINVTVGSPTISVQCALTAGYFAGSLYLAPTDSAGAYGVSNWNVITITPSTATATGVTSSSLVDTNGFVTPASFTAYNVQDGWHEKLTITNTDTASARMMNTYWYANPSHTPSTNAILFTFTNLPNDYYDVYVYVLQQVSPDTGGGNVEVYDSSYTNYVFYGESFGSTSNFITAIDTTDTGPLPYVNYVLLQMSTGGSNSLSFTESGLTTGVGGSGVPGIQITPVSVPVANNNTYSRNGLKNWMIPVNNLMTNATDADGDTLTLYSVGASTNGITPVITTSPAYVSYYNTNLVDDKFTYTVTNGFGRSSTGTITLLAGTVGGSGASGQISGIAFTNGVASMNFAGIPGYKYNVQVSTNLSIWNTIWTTNAPAGGVFQFNDNAAPTPDAYYRLMWNGN